MTTSATKIANATTNSNCSRSSSNNSNRNTDTSTTSDNNNNNENKIINKNINNFNNNNNNSSVECITTTNNVKILNPPVAPTSSHIVSKEEPHINNIMRDDKNMEMAVIEHPQHREIAVATEVEKDAEEEFPMKIENLSMGIKMPLNMTRTNCFITAATTTTTKTISTKITSNQNSNNNNSSSSNNNMFTTITTSSGLTTTAAATRAMQSDEDFNIRFVNLVRNHKCLYDKKVPEYRNRDNQEKAWSLISHETRESVIHCKERWRNLRACLSRYIKQQSSNDPQHKPYYLTEHMSFLLPFLKSTRNGVGFPMEAHTNNNNIHNHHQHHNNGYQNSNNHQAHQQQTTYNGVDNLSALFQISSAAAQQPPTHIHLPAMSVIPLGNEVDLTTVTTAAASGRVIVKHSLSENDDEETIDAFDPAISSTLQQQQFNMHTPSMQYQQQQQHNLQEHQLSISPALSDTASANSMQHFIPDVQLSEAQSVHDDNHHEYHLNHDIHINSHMGSSGGVSISPIPLRHDAKRIKLECDGAPLNGHLCHCGDKNYNNNNNINRNLCTNPDMEFFRSILPDIVNLTAQQKRKFKIGILELIDDVVTRYPAQTTAAATSTTTNTANVVNLSSITATNTNSVIEAASMPMNNNHLLINNINSNNKSHRHFSIHERRK